MPLDQDALERLRKLRRLGVRRGARDLQPRATPGRELASHGLPGEAVRTPHGPAWVRTARYALAENADMAALPGLSSEAWGALGRDPALLALDPARAASVDTETTGLSLGAGTYTFLIGIGTYEGPNFVVRQYFMRSPAEERAQLHLVEEALARCTGLVTFNGRAFDLPLLQNRFVLAHLPPPLPGAPHLDLLPPARRIWRAHLGSCALSHLEREVLGVQRTLDDVPGWMIPGIYRDFYGSGANAESSELMARVFYHNLQDIASMSLLAARMGWFFEPALPPDTIAGLHPLVCASLARCYEALNWTGAGEAAYRAALAGQLADGDRAGILRDLSLLLKRLERRDEAAAVWETWIGSVALPDPTPYIELAKHHEWQTRDIAAARGWAAWALQIAEADRPGPRHDETVAELRRRLQRLERKLNGETTPEQPDRDT